VVGETVVIIIEDVGAAVGETEVGEELGDLVAVGEDVGVGETEVGADAGRSDSGR
jgi:hypothetical protein